MWPFHRHKYEVIDVKHGEFVNFGGGQLTMLLFKCRCHAVKTETVPGHWPAEHFMTDD